MHYGNDKCSKVLLSCSSVAYVALLEEPSALANSFHGTKLEKDAAFAQRCKLKVVHGWALQYKEHYELCSPELKSMQKRLAASYESSGKST